MTTKWLSKPVAADDRDPEEVRRESHETWHGDDCGC
jgi:hypothetical protein